MTLRLTFGIDPGLSGAVATLIDGEPGPLVDMPTFHNGTANEVDAAELAAFLRSMRATYPGAYVSACIERVRAMPSTGPDRRTMGAQSSFNFGDGFGQVKAVFRALGIDTVLVEAQCWKRRYGLIGRDKDAGRQLALLRFPSIAHLLKRKKDHGRADAALIGLYHESTATQGARAA